MLTGNLLVVVAVASTFSLASLWGQEGLAQTTQGGGEGGPSESVTLELRGEGGTSFSGFCSVGDERRDIGGEAPRRFEFDTVGRKLSCEIRKESGRDAALEVALSGEGARSVQRIEGTDGTLKLTYEEGAVSSSMSSVSSQRADGAGSSSSSDEGAPGSGEGEDLAARVQQMVDEILESVLR